MSEIKLCEFIQQVNLFETLTMDELKETCMHFSLQEFKPGSIIFQENGPRAAIHIIAGGECELYKTTAHGKEKRLAYFTRGDFMGEGCLFDNSPHTTNCRAVTDVKTYKLKKEDILSLFRQNHEIALKMFTQLGRVITRRMHHANSHVVNPGSQYISGKYRNEHDLLGERQVPDEAYYGIQTLRGMENFNISGITLSFFPQFIKSLAIVKMGATMANLDLGLIEPPVANAIIGACNEIINGKYHRHFVVDMIQGGAGTSTNMNANEVIANRALELLGHQKGEYQFCHPNNHVNLSQSTNDAYPTAIKIALLFANIGLIETLNDLIDSFNRKAKEFSHVIKMGRTQLQDAVPMTLGQEFEAWAVTLSEETDRLEQNVRLFLEVNMGATAIGTGINSVEGYAEKCVMHLASITGFDMVLAKNLVEATQDSGAFIMYSSAIKRLAVKLSKICSDLRLLSSGPRTGINEINLPPMQPGSSIMPGKVNPVIPEVVNQIAYKVIGNDLTVTFAVEAGQLELNVMEPVIVQSLFESIEMLKNGMNTLRLKCIDGITANEKRCRQLVENSIGLVTALNPVIGYEASTQVAKEALEQNKGVYELVLEKKLLTKEQLDEILTPENMIRPQRAKT